MRISRHVLSLLFFGASVAVAQDSAQPFLRKRGLQQKHTVVDNYPRDSLRDKQKESRQHGEDTQNEVSQLWLRILDEEFGSLASPYSTAPDSNNIDAVNNGSTTAAASTSSPAADNDDSGGGNTLSTSSPATDNEGVDDAELVSKQNPWPHEQSDIPLDPSVVTGELKNGMRYMLMSNSEPPGKLEMRLHIDAGANMETEEERGLAHFLEHMMFQATETFPEADLIPTFQRLGVQFGRHVNAYTDVLETVYELGLPNTNEETLRPSFAWMRDVLGGALLEQDKLDVEQGVVISELETRDSVEQRLYRESMKWRFPDHLVSKRFVIGTKETLRGLTRDMFIDFYERYYVPSRATLILVGDMDVLDMKAWMETFESVPDSGPVGEEPDYGSVPEEGQGLQSNVFVNDQVGQLDLTIERFSALEMLPDTEATRIEQLRLSVANSIVSRRIQKLLDEEDTAIVWGGAFTDRAYNLIDSGYVWVQPKEVFWRESVAALEQELRRAQLFGFTQAEVDEDAANILTFYEQEVLSKATRHSASLANSLKNTVNNHFVFSTPEETLRIVNLAMENLTPELAHGAFRTYWNTSDIYIYLTTNELDVSVEEASQELKDLYTSSQLVEVIPPVEEEVAPFAYTNFGPPGTIVSDTFIEDLEIRQLILSNNVRVNMKQTDFMADSISMVARFGTGRLGQPRQRTYLDQFAQYLMAYGGLGEHTWSELGTILAGKNAGASFSIQDGFFDISGGSNAEDLLLGLQLMVAHFTDPAFGDEAVRWFNDEIPGYLNYINQSLDGVFDFEMYGWLLGGDQRFTAPSEEELAAFIAEDARDWLVPSLNNSYLELSLVGDLDQEQAIAFILETFGALPVRTNAPPEITDKERSIAIPAAPQTTSFFYESALPQAATTVVWEIPSLIKGSIDEDRKFNILASIFADRMRVTIREELGGTYSPDSWHDSNDAFDYGLFFAYVDGLPEELDTFANSIMSIAENMTTTGLIDDDEFVRAVAPFQTSVSDSARSNSYWLYSVMAECQARPIKLEWSRSRTAFYETLTVEELNDLAQTYLTQDGALRISLLPVTLDAV